MNIGILGCRGSIGLRHTENFKKLGHEVYGYDECFGRDLSARAFMIDASDAIIIATPTKEHVSDLMDVLDAGKHVLVEKPIGYDCPPFIQGLIEGYRSKGTKAIIATGFNLRFHECVKYVKGHLDELGGLKAASFSVLQKSNKPEYIRDGVLRNWLSHEIDLAHWLLGPGSVRSCTCDDQVDCNLWMKFPTVKDTVYLNADYITEPHQRFFWIEGEKGAFYVNLERREVYRRDESREVKTVLVAGDNWDQNYREEALTFINSIEVGKHLKPLATAEDGVRSLYTVMQARFKAGLEKLDCPEVT